MFLLCFCLAGLSSCNKIKLSAEDPHPTFSFAPKLSSYGIFQKNTNALTPTDSFEVYELATPLFNDYSSKQRLVKLPKGEMLISNGDGLPEFPNGTLLVKSFYYLKDESDVQKGKTIMETRLEIRSDNNWNVATYVWNESQTDADLNQNGLNKTVSFKNSLGSQKTVNYHIPSSKECVTCHLSKNTISPIGPKLRNLNTIITKDAAEVNQLTFFKNTGLLNVINESLITKMPHWDDPNETIENRSRAYLDVNCAHCHNKQGWSSNLKLDLAYETPFAATEIAKKKNKIMMKMQSGKMPQIGTTMVHEEGLALIKDYINQL